MSPLGEGGQVASGLALAHAQPGRYVGQFRFEGQSWPMPWNVVSAREDWPLAGVEAGGLVNGEW